MPDPSPPANPVVSATALIIGCGYLGRHLAARLIARGATVYGTTRSQAHAAQLAALGVRPLLLEVTQPVTYASLAPALEADPLDVYVMIPPGRLNGDPSTRNIVLGGTGHLLQTLKHASVRRAVMVSSSAVYGQTGGECVDADTPPAPNNPRAELLLAGERLWLDAGDAYRVLRLAGLYGPGRIIGEKALRDRAPLVGNPDALLNLIHVEDAVDLLQAVMTSEAAAHVELGCDGRPVKRLAYYLDLADRLGVPAPAVMDPQTAAAQFGMHPDRLMRTANKMLDNSVTRRRTGWSPTHADYRQGLDALLQNPAGPPQPHGHPC